MLAGGNKQQQGYSQDELGAEGIFYFRYEHSHKEVDNTMEEVEGQEMLLVAALKDIDKVVDPSVSVDIAAECLHALQLSR